jgi:predicted dehydrogenase
VTPPARVRVGVVGCGLIAQVIHLPYLRELPELYEIAALCDLSTPLVERVGAEYGVDRLFQHWGDMLDCSRLDAVLLLTSGSHAPAAVAASQAGLHVFTEKPMCLSSEEGVRMVRAARDAGRQLMVGYMKRYDPAFARLEREVAVLDDLRLVRATTLESALEPYVAHYPLRRAAGAPADALERLRADDEARVDRALGPVSGLARRSFRWVLLDSLVHELNLLRAALGEPDRLEFADLGEHHVTIVLDFGRAQCVVCWVDLPGIARYQQEFAFYAPQRRISLTFPSPFLRSMPTELVVEGGEPGSARSWRTTETVSYEEAFKRELIEFHGCVVEGREPRTTGADGLRDVVLCEAIVASHEAGHAGRDQPTALPVAERR